MFRTAGVFLLSLFAAVCSSAQGGDPKADQPVKPDLSKEGYVVESRLTKVTFENDGSGTQEIELRIRIQADAAVKQFGQLVFPFQSSSDKLEIVYVRVRKPDGTVITTPPGNVLEMPAEVTHEAPMYSDLHQKHVTVKALGVGDTLEYLVRMRRERPDVPGQFWYVYNFADSEILLADELQITIPRERSVVLKSPQFKPTVADNGPRRTYTWKTSNLKRKEPDEQPRQAPGHAPPPDVQLTTFASWEQVGRWYADLQKDSLKPTAELRAKAEELTRAAKTDDDKLAALYKYVSTHIRYVGLEFGVGRYQPHAADDVLSNEYGDCKDKHTLLAAMAAAIGLTVYPALVTSGRELDPAVPSPGQFDHVITAVPKGTAYVWLDTTAEVAPFGLVLPFLRDKPALVITDTHPPALVNIPAALPIPNYEHFMAEAKLGADGVLSGKMGFEARGDPEVVFRLMFRRVAQAQWKDAVQQLSYALGYGGTVTDVVAGAPDEPDKPFAFSYQYSRKDYSDWENRRITPPFPPILIPEWKDDDKTPGPMPLGPSTELQHTAKIELPPGSSPELPKDVHLKTDFADYDVTYSFSKGVLSAERRLTVKKSEVAVVAKKDYQRFRKAIEDDVTHFIDLGLSAPAKAENQALRGLLAAARKAAENGQLDAAVSGYKHVTELDPESLDGWWGLGWTHMRMNHGAEALAALKKAAELAPQNMQLKRELAMAYVVNNRMPDAAKLLRELLQANPNDQEAARMLDVTSGKGFYVTSVENTEAEKENIAALENAVLEKPNNASLHTALGNAFLRKGDVDKGLAELEKSADIDGNPSAVSAVAVAMVEHHHKAAEALPLVTKNCNALEADSARTALAQLQYRDLERVQQLANYWHVLGWIYSREGYAAKAEEYLKAAWILSQDSAAGAHLAEVYEKQGNRTAAINTYAMAISAGEIQKQTKRLFPDSDLEWTRGRLYTLTPMHASDLIRDAAGQLSRMRETKLPQLKAAKGSAEFFLLISPGSRVEDVKFISGTEALRSAAEALKTAKLNVRFPEGSTAKLVRRGILVCGSVGCDFVLMTPDSVSLN